MKHVQLIGHNAEGANSYIGLEREVTIDEDNDQLRLHDGATPGGRIFSSRNENDTRYQVKNPELDGFVFPEEAKGIMVRLGAGAYQIRQVVARPNEITVDFGNGQLDDITIGLADTIDGDRTLTGEIDFLQPVQAPEFIGDFTGDTAGTHTGPVNGDVTGDLQGSTQGNHTGGLDARGAEVFFDNGQIPYEAIGGVPEAPPSPIPVGAIMMWSGDVASIPLGWFLCNGDNGTPDLRSKFIMGVNPGTNEPLSEGGSATHNHVIELENSGSHQHDITVAGTILTIAQMPSHSHTNGVCDNVSNDIFNHGAVGANPTTANSVESNSADGVQEGNTATTGGGQAHNHAGSSAAAGTHTHNASSQNTNHLPTYIALCFIMKGP